ncbi:MAG: hypothetical protein ACR2PM_09685 [Hyphomicrobiales bacterium]
MKTVKTSLAAMAVVGFVMSPVGAVAGQGKDPVRTVGCGIVTIATAPIWIFTGDKPDC